MRASYRKGVQWIAENDDPCCVQQEDVAEMISTLLLADLFGKSPHAVAHDIVQYRRNAALREG